MPKDKRICEIDGEDDEKDNPVISLSKAMAGVVKGTLIECRGCSTKKARAFHTRKSFPELFKRSKHV